MGVETGEPILDPANVAPPSYLVNRKVYVQFDRLSTIVVPHDPKDSSIDRWIPWSPSGSKKSIPLVTEGNDVRYLVDGHEVFREYAFELESTSGPNDFIYLAGWWFDRDTPFLSSSTAGQVLQAAAYRHVQLRVMLPLNSEFAKFFQHFTVIDWLNSLQPCCAILDRQYPAFGTHHQKILLIKQGGALTAYCGGADINSDRVTSKPDDGQKTPQHDVNCRINGPAAHSVLTTFCERWDANITVLKEERLRVAVQKKTLKPPEPIPEEKLATAQTVPIPKRQGDMSIAIGRTYGTGPIFQPEFAPSGEQSVLEVLSTAIRAARTFIYLEDQYLVDIGIAQLLRESLKTIKHLIILIPTNELTGELPQIAYRRHQFVTEVLRDGNGQKLHVYCLSKVRKGCGLYVHSKLGVFDDDYAVVSSANLNRRGMTHDSEIIAGIFDPSTDHRLTYSFAHRLRVRLWGHHLGMDNAKGHAELADGLASVAHWITPPSTARITPFVSDVPPDDVLPIFQRPHNWGRDAFWDHLLDPDGS